MKVVSYILYDADNITAIVCADCATPEEIESVDDQPVGATEITEPYVVICDRCGR